MGNREMNCKIFYCCACSKGFLLEDEALQCGCNPKFLVKGIFTTHVKRTRWERFVHWFFSVDIKFLLAFMSAIIINAILMTHIGLSFKECLLEGLCMGFFLPRLLE